MRQTDLSYEELVSILADPQRNGREEPACFFLNEMGGILLEGNKDADRAGTYLLEVLEQEDEAAKFIALCYLIIAPTVYEYVNQKLQQFVDEPRNEEIVTRARRATSCHSGGIG